MFHHIMYNCICELGKSEIKGGAETRTLINVSEKVLTVTLSVGVANAD